MKKTDNIISPLEANKRFFVADLDETQAPLLAKLEDFKNENNKLKKSKKRGGEENG